jgi:hypothetical protein
MVAAFFGFAGRSGLPKKPHWDGSRCHLFPAGRSIAVNGTAQAVSRALAGAAPSHLRAIRNRIDARDTTVTGFTPL